MRKSRVHWVVPAVLVASLLLAASLGKWSAGPRVPPLPLNDWDIPTLVEHLQRTGLSLRMVATQKDGPIDSTAFLTTTEKDWRDFNHLSKNVKQIEAWRGTVYCERADSQAMQADLVQQWGDFGLSVGPFLFYGDPDLLTRVRAALLDPPPMALPWPTPGATRLASLTGTTAV
jgi:hypothetical protein